MITTIYDNLDVDTQEAINYLRCSEDDEQLVEMLVKAIKRKADQFVQREEEYFTKNEEVAIPEDIKLWVFEVLGRKYNRRANGLSSDNISGFGAVQWDKEDYAELWKYRKLPGT